MKRFNKRAFTLIELLIVIAIIGILFIVLVSKVDFATDKAKATGVQTDFRSFQVAFETVAKENAGFNMFGWDEGDISKESLWHGKRTPDGQIYSYTNKDKDAGDRIRNSYDQGDANLNGIQESTETWVGRKIYTEEWTGIYTLINPGDSNDYSAVAALETAINANLDPKLHITIANKNANGQYKISMANQAQDPWKSEYEGAYLTNASSISSTNESKDMVKGDKLDRGAIIMYSKGANLELGSVEEVINGEVVVTVLTPSKEASVPAGKPDNNKAGADDYSIATIYTYKNGYGEIVSSTTGFSNNQTNSSSSIVADNQGPVGYNIVEGANQVLSSWQNLVIVSDANFADFSKVLIDGVELQRNRYTVTSGSTRVEIDRKVFAQYPTGTHTIEIVSKNGSASTQFTSAFETVTFSIWNSTDTFTLPANMTWADWIMSGNLGSSENQYVWVSLDGSTIYYNARYQGLTNQVPGEEYKLYDENGNLQKVNSVIQNGFYGSMPEECCFDAGSQVLMADGTTKNIEDVMVGDMVMSLNELTGEFIAQRVSNTIIKHNSDDLVYVHLSNGVVIGMRAYHPLLTTEGYKSLRPNLAEAIKDVGNVELLVVGDVLVGYGENVTIVDIEVREPIENYDTYNLTIEGFHNYIVNGVVVHNASCPT